VTLQVWPGELRQWIREYTPRLLAVARAFADGDTEAEDLLQEVWWKAAQGAASRAGGVPLGAWLVAVTVNVGRDHLRRQRRRRLLLILWSGGEKVTHPAPPPIHEGTRLWRAVGSLPILQRDVLILRVVEEFSVAETAAVLGRAEGTIKVSLRRALTRLRAHFDEEGRWIPNSIRATLI
jgi:RNA polymerase sigma-70 factor (ECF subfamily)